MKEASPVPTVAWVLLVVIAAGTGMVGWLLNGAGPVDADYQTL